MTPSESSSTFGERFSFARWYEAGHIRDETDEQFAAAVGRTKGAASQWRRAKEPPPADICRAIAARAGVDPGWLMLGERSQAPHPQGFTRWLEVQREGNKGIRPYHGEAPKKTAAKKGGRRTG